MNEEYPTNEDASLTAAGTVAELDNTADRLAKALNDLEERIRPVLAEDGAEAPGRVPSLAARSDIEAVEHRFSELVDRVQYVASRVTA